MPFQILIVYPLKMRKNKKQKTKSFLEFNARSIKPHKLRRQPFILLCLCPLAFKTTPWPQWAQVGGKNQLWKALPTMMIQLIITFPYFTIRTWNGLKKKKKRHWKKKDKRSNLCNITSYNKTCTRVTVFCYINTLQERSWFLP